MRLTKGYHQKTYSKQLALKYTNWHVIKKGLNVQVNLLRRTNYIVEMYNKLLYGKKK